MIDSLSNVALQEAEIASCGNDPARIACPDPSPHGP
jgi:hypothetical protein